MNTTRYDLTSEPEGFSWFGRPKNVTYENGLLVTTNGKTDFWQRTHYGFRKDDGHALLRRIAGDFALTTHVSWDPVAQYDQCGVFIRVDAANWAKASVEYEGDEPARLGSVVTSLGYSDWATQDVARSTREMSYRLSKRGPDILFEYSEDEERWYQMRIAHLHAAADELEAGVYACSPLGEGFTCRFSYIGIGDTPWDKE